MAAFRDLSQGRALGPCLLMRGRRESGHRTIGEHLGRNLTLVRNMRQQMGRVGLPRAWSVTKPKISEQPVREEYNQALRELASGNRCECSSEWQGA